MAARIIDGKKIAGLTRTDIAARAAMLEAERIARDPSVKRYSDVEEALRALKE